MLFLLHLRMVASRFGVKFLSTDAHRIPWFALRDIVGPGVLMNGAESCDGMRALRGSKER